ncbi:TPA: hypothetical protein ACPUVD_004923 [Klebsiella pneumoniae]|uniref:hypothetical protein n=1 Tax=Klebsiella pneumoniae TaxID=573 RepID=UPI0024AEFD70|nr:hypothetical protein [Klebsiella pneumoniae]MDI7015356.1 hypothetical protein [Klebsiella pneumoniae]MDI7063317.1 hypothetical protein [Klebsiella pneumoniae]MDI7103787.1 hypothetical protein [Klebsiella pneumoniae]
MTDITELAQSLKAAAIDAKELAIIARYSKGRAAAEKFYALANPNNVIALVEALEKAQTERDEFRSRLKLERSILEDADKRIAELESHKAALLKFIRDSCYVFDGADEDISDAYVDAITSGLMPKLEAGSMLLPPLFWVRVKSDGGYEGPIHDSKLEDVRKKSGEWLPLTLAGGIPELESRTVTVKLPQRLQPGADGWDDWYVHSDDEGEYLKFDDVLAMLTAAGIKVEAE